MKEKITGIILAGGEGRRVQHQDKGLLEWRGKSLIDHVIQRLNNQVDDCIISCNRNMEHYEKRGLPCFSDQLEGFQGPLAGVQAGLERSTSPLAIIVSCDCPELPLDLVDRLYCQLLASASNAAYAYDGTRDQYLAAIISTQALSSLNDYLARGERSVRGWYQAIEASRCDFSDQPLAFRNFNSPEAFD